MKTKLVVVALLCAVAMPIGCAPDQRVMTYEGAVRTHHMAVSALTRLAQDPDVEWTEDQARTIYHAREAAMSALQVWGKSLVTGDEEAAQTAAVEASTAIRKLIRVLREVQE